MVDLCVDLQDQMLDMLEEQNPENEEFSIDLKHIRTAVPPNEEQQAKVDREQAEHRVKLFVLQHGERIGHGDLLTFQKVSFIYNSLHCYLNCNLLQGQHSEVDEGNFCTGNRQTGVHWPVPTAALPPGVNYILCISTFNTVHLKQSSSTSVDTFFLSRELGCLNYFFSKGKTTPFIYKYTFSSPDLPMLCSFPRLVACFSQMPFFPLFTPKLSLDRIQLHLCSGDGKDEPRYKGCYA